MADPGGKPETPRPTGVPKKRPGETHPAEYSTTPQVPVQEPLDPFPGRVFGDYEILERIARGGMGVVYKARQISLNRLVALKIIPGSELANPVERQRFRIEVEAAANIDHPRIVPIYEVGERDGYYFYSMRLIEGGSLAQHMARYREDHRAAARLIISAARGIHYAHQRGILHRDLKPANILLDNDGRPHVADFGVAKHLPLTGLDASSAANSGNGLAAATSTDPAAESQRGRPPSGELDLTQVGEIIGTPSYMAPEQASGKKGVVTVAADIYSLGAILYEMLTGRPPFKGPTRMATVRQVLTERPIPPRQLNPKIDRDLERICLKCLERDPQQRYSSADALADDLERWLAGEPVLAAPATWWYRTWKWMKRRPTMAALVAATAIVTALGLAGITWQARLAHSQAERAWLAETSLQRARERLRQQQYRWHCLHALRTVQQASELWRQGDWVAARQVLAQVSPEQRRWEWHWLDAQLQWAEQPFWRHPSLVVGYSGSEEGLVVAEDGQVWTWPVLEKTLSTRRSVLALPTETGSVGVSANGIREGLVFEDGLLAVWTDRQAAAWLRHEVVPRWSWQGFAQSIAAVCFSPQRTSMAVVWQSSAAGDWFIALYGQDRFPQLLRVPGGKPCGCNFVGENAFLLFTEEGQVFLWSSGPKSWDVVPWQARLPVGLQHAALDTNGHFLLALADGTYRLGRWRPGWNTLWLDDPQTVPAQVQAVAMAENGQRYALALNDGTIMLGHRLGSTQRLRLPRALPIRQLRFSHFADELAWVANGEELWRLPLDLSVRSQSVPLPPNSKPAPGRWPRHLTISSTIAATSLQQVLAATADGQLLAAPMPKTDQEEISQYRDLARFGKEVTCLAWSDSGNFVLVALADGTVHLGRCRLGEENWVWQDFQHGSTIRKLAVGPGGEWFASWDDRGKLCLWDVELLVPVFELVHLPEGCTALHTSPLGLHCRDGSGLWRTWRIPASSVQPH